MRQNLISRTAQKLTQAVITRMPNASDNVVLATVLAMTFVICSSLVAIAIGGLQLLGVVSMTWVSWFLFSVFGGGCIMMAIIEAGDGHSGKAVLWVIGYPVCFVIGNTPTLENLAWWLTLVLVVASVIMLAKAICQIYPAFCRRGRRILQTRVLPGIKESFRFTKVHLKRTGRHIARWWRNDAKQWLSAARVRVHTWFTTTALPWIGSALKWFFGLLWEHKWAILAVGGGYLAYELYNPRKGEWYEVWEWGKQSWWWIASITAAVVGALVWLPKFREMLFELVGDGLGIAAKAYRTHYNGIVGGWKALYWLSLLGTPVAIWWLWNNYYRKDLWVLAVVGFICFFVAHFGQDGDKAAKKVVDAWEGAKTAKR